MPLAHFKIVRVVGWCDFYHTGSEFHIHIRIRHDRNLPVYKGEQHLSSYQVFVSFVLRIHCYRRIPQHCFRPGGGEFQEFLIICPPVSIGKRIFNMPEMPRLFFVFHFCIGNRSIAYRTPVNDPASFINPSLFMHFAEYFRHRPVAAFVHGKTLSVPITG